MNFTEKTQKFVILSISNSPWNSPYWTSRQFLTYEISKYVPVIYMEDRSGIHNLLSRHRKNGLKTQNGAPFASPENLTVSRVTDFFPRIYRWKKTDGMLCSLLSRLVKRKYIGKDRRQIVAYLWEPHLHDYIPRLCPDVVVYHIYDKFEKLAPSEAGKTKVRSDENRMIQLADIVITPHSNIASQLDHDNVHVVPNGIFLPAFPDPLSKSAPHLTLGGRKPCIGYIGVINSKVDFDTLLFIAQSRPEWSLMLIGPINSGSWQNQESYHKLKQLNNVHFLPPVPVNRVAEFMTQIDIGLMPYRLDTWAGFCESPLKMYQYWGTGLPVITSLPNVHIQTDHLYLAKTPAEWVDAIEKTLKNESEERKRDRRLLAVENSWERRARQVVEIISDHLAQQ